MSYSVEQLALVYEGEREETGLRTPCSLLFSPRSQAARSAGAGGRRAGALSLQRREHGECRSGLRVLSGDFLHSIQYWWIVVFLMGL